MENPIQNVRQRSIVFEKLGILSQKFKTLTSSNYVLNISLSKCCTCFSLTSVYKRVFEIFFICLDCELSSKIEKDLLSTHSQKPVFFYIFINNSGSKQYNTVKQETCAKFQQKILNCTADE